jgi:TolB-like protein/class 3 adenylate cyclase
VERRLVAVLAADVAGYSRLMGADEEGTLDRLKAVRKAVVDPTITSHRGRIVKTTGDGMLVEFASAVDAARSAVEVQRSMAEQNTVVPQDQRIEFRIGIHVGDIIIDENDIFGDGVNIAARLEAIAEPGGVCLSDDAYRQIRGKVEIAYDDLGPQTLKNILEPMRAWRVRLGGQGSAAVKPVSLAHQAPTLALPDKPSIAVLPFQNMSGDPEQEYFADGVVEDIITALSRVKWLFVIARNSSFTYKGKAVDIRQIGRELGVRYVLEGSVRKGGNRVRITGQLIDASTGAHLWADRFDGDLNHIFELQDEVSATVANAIAPKLEQAETERSKQKPTQSLAAYDLLLRARASYRGTIWRPAGPAYVDEAHELLLRAIALDPEFAPAHAAAAFTFCIRKANNWVKDPLGEMEEADRFGRAAVRYGPDDPVALCKVGHTLAYVVRDLAAGLHCADRALALAPNLAIANLYGAFVCVWSGDTESAIGRLSRAMRLSPLDPMHFAMQGMMAHAHFHAGRYSEAVRWAEASRSGQPDDHTAARIVAASYAMAGDAEQAQRALVHLKRIDPMLRVSTLRNVLGPYRPEALARYEEGLRLAGLPE